MPREPLAETALILLVWSLAGALFGALFLALEEMLRNLGFSGWQPIVFGACAAGMTTSAFYSAMSVALIGSGAGVLGSIAYLIVAGQTIELPLLAGSAALTGLLAEIVLGWGARANAGALGVTLTGFLAGIGAGLAVAIALSLAPWPVAPAAVAAGVVAMVGALFQLNVAWLIRACRGRWAVQLGAALVAALIAAVIGTGIWIMVSMTSVAAELSTGSLARLLDDVPAGLLGGAMGGATAGLLLQLLGVRIELRSPL